MSSFMCADPQALLHCCRQQDAVLPTISGSSQDKLDSWWTSRKEYVTQQLPPFALEVITPGSVQVRSAPGLRRYM
jgi:hypothetical protein